MDRRTHLQARLESTERQVFEGRSRIARLEGMMTLRANRVPNAASTTHLLNAMCAAQRLFEADLARVRQEIAELGGSRRAGRGHR